MSALLNPLFSPRYLITGQVGGPGTFWEGYTIEVGRSRWLWMAKLRGWLYLQRYPCRAIYISLIDNDGEMSPEEQNVDEAYREHQDIRP